MPTPTPATTRPRINILGFTWRLVGDLQRGDRGRRSKGHGGLPGVITWLCFSLSVFTFKFWHPESYDIAHPDIATPVSPIPWQRQLWKDSHKTACWYRLLGVCSSSVCWNNLRNLAVKDIDYLEDHARGLVAVVNHLGDRTSKSRKQDYTPFQMADFYGL